MLGVGNLAEQVRNQSLDRNSRRLRACRAGSQSGYAGHLKARHLNARHLNADPPKLGRGDVQTSEPYSELSKEASQMQVQNDSPKCASA